MMDFINPISYSAGLNPYSDQMLGSYPPMCYVLFYGVGKFLSAMNPCERPIIHTIGTFTSVLFFLAIFVSLDADKIKKVLFCFFLFISGIYINAYERGNLILLAAVCVIFFIMNYKSSNKFVKEFSLLVLAFAAAMKCTPAILGLLLVYDKDYKSALRLIVYGVLLAILPFLCLKGGFANISLCLDNMSLFVYSHVFSDSSLGRYHCLSYIASFCELFGVELSLYQVHKLIAPFFYLLGAVVLFLSFYEKVMWRRVLLLTSLMIYLPAISHFYTALYLFPVIVLFFNDKQHSRQDIIYVVLFVLILNPCQLFIDNINLTPYLLSGAVSLLVLLVLFQSGNNYLMCRKAGLRQ